jgi:glycosyl hydrolase family 115 (putative glucuronidase)/glycosyl hydrolase family 115
MIFPRLLLACFACALASTPASRAALLGTGGPGDFPLVRGGVAAPIVYAAADFKVVDLAAHDLAADIERVTGQKPAVLSADGAIAAARAPFVLIGTLGKNPAIDALVAAGKLDVSALRGAWESFLIATVADPLPGIPSALAIVGSDRRGTAFGVYEVSQGIGVSPWYWWADVAPAKKTELAIAAGTRRFGPPSVKYRGIFINDEDWGLHQWAAKTFEPEHGSIGPRIYAKIFELLLRLKANTLWPAMHAVTKPFNTFPEDAPLADDYAIVMGSSHAEPMLRNNVGEWHDAPERYNYLTNREGVLKYWDERVAANGQFENFYTLGMRGIHDSAMQGPKTNPERIATLEKIFADQRALLAAHVRPDLDRVPQLFCAYKEVLPLYRGGLRVPDDVTVMFPDDNFGYIRDFPSAAERTRSGGFGVYYHLSYLGAPLSYLWLCTTPPALVCEEMTKAYEQGARTVWIANVGDLKPAELDTELFLSLAWDITRWRPDNIDSLVSTWAAREFGPNHAHEIADLLSAYHQLNYQRKPEHLQWWMPKEPPRPSSLSRREIDERLAAFGDLVRRTEGIAAQLPPKAHDSFFELIAYPIRGSALANERYFFGELGAPASTDAAPFADRAQQADASLRAETETYDLRTAGGKWRNLMHLEPADNDWRSMRIAAWAPPHFTAPPPVPTPSGTFISLEAEHFTRKTDRPGAAWTVIRGLGRTGEGSVALLPSTAPSLGLDELPTAAPRLDYDVTFAAPGDFPVTVFLIPTHPLTGPSLRFAFALDDAPPQLVSLEVKDGGTEWAHGVVDATRLASTHLTVPTAGRHTLRLYGVEAGVLLDKIVIDCGGLTPSYLGPPDTFAAKN